MQGRWWALDCAGSPRGRGHVGALVVNVGALHRRS